MIAWPASHVAAPKTPFCVCKHINKISKFTRSHLPPSFSFHGRQPLLKLFHPAPFNTALRPAVARSSSEPTFQMSASSQISVRKVETPGEIEEFRGVTRKYLEWLGEDLGFQGVERELASLPGAYSSSARGCMLLAYEVDPARASPAVCVGAVALRSVSDCVGDGVDSLAGFPKQDVCEMKRLFVVAGHHRRGVGTALTQALLREAAALGYRAMVLDTLDRLEGANKLYRAQGFDECERYNDCPLPGVMYFTKRLECESEK